MFGDGLSLHYLTSGQYKTDDRQWSVDRSVDRLIDQKRTTTTAAAAAAASEMMIISA